MQMSEKENLKRALHVCTLSYICMHASVNSYCKIFPSFFAVTLQLFQIVHCFCLRCLRCPHASASVHLNKIKSSLSSSPPSSSLFYFVSANILSNAWQQNRRTAVCGARREEQEEKLRRHKCAPIHRLASSHHCPSVPRTCVRVSVCFFRTLSCSCSPFIPPSFACLSHFNGQFSSLQPSRPN